MHGTGDESRRRREQLGDISPVTAPLLAIYPNPTECRHRRLYVSDQQQHEREFRTDTRRPVFSASDTFFARVTTDASNVDSPSTMAFTCFNGVAFPQFRGDAENRNVFATLSESHIFTPALLNSARLSFSRTNFGSGDYTASVG